MIATRKDAAGMRERDHELGLHGLALLRATDEQEVAVHRDAIAQLVATDDGTGDPRRLPEVGSREGYATWAQTYDGQGNRAIRAEDPVMAGLLEELGPGDGRRAVDAGCGTGRHTAKLAERGWDVVGVDGSPEMLEVARERVPGADLREGDLRELPVEDAWADVAVCALALSHLPDLAAMGELGRILRPGGVLLLSNPHPVATGLLGARAWCRTPVGERVQIPEWAHPVGAYLDAFRAAGLVAERCLEPAYGAGDGLVAGLPAVIVWRAVRVP
jgi:SAM-dependent methyltransferase